MRVLSGHCAGVAAARIFSSYPMDSSAKIVAPTLISGNLDLCLLVLLLGNFDTRL
jgi:hypothetical protein